MTRSDKIRKLSNAIKEFRGRYHPNTGKWIQPPNPAKETRIIFWLTKLGREAWHVSGDMETIKEFQNFGQFSEWIKRFEAASLPSTSPHPS